MELLNQWIITVLYAASPLVGYFLFTVASHEVRFGKDWLWVAVSVAIIASGSILLFYKRSLTVILALVLSLCSIGVGYFQGKSKLERNKNNGYKFFFGLETPQLLWVITWVGISFLGIEGIVADLLEVSSTVIISGLIIGSLSQNKQLAYFLSSIPFVVGFVFWVG